MVGAILEKLIEQIAIGSVYFYAVKTGQLRVLRSVSIGLDNAGNLRPVECTRRYILGQGPNQAYMASGTDCAGSNREFASQKTWVRDAAHVPYLHEDAASRFMNGFSHWLPGPNLLG
jgi:hypothetical protein